MKYSKIRIMDEPSRLEWWKRKLEADKELEVLSVSEILKNKGTERHYRIFIEVARKEDVRNN